MNQCRAVCIGINYPGTSAQLSGCVNDAKDWEAALAALGFKCALVLDEFASKARIVAALTDFVSQTGYRDRLIVTYSGHGTWVPDADGDEPDGRDEALVPIDYRTAGVITDDELYGIFS